MKKIIKIIDFLAPVILAGGVLAGIRDIWEQKRNEKKAEAEGKKFHRPHGPYEKYFKRPLDFILSAWALIVLSPVLAVMAVLVKVKLGSPVFFQQKRPGKDEMVFTLFKYRSMTSERDKDGELLSDEERLTGFGKALRSTSMDELPELYNILKGDMSFVGPRPLLVEYLPRYSERQKHRHDVRPGLTGLAQVSGRNGISWEEKFEDDVKYVEHISFIGDWKIMVKTIVTVMKRDGISSTASATVEYFMGNEEKETM